MYQFPDYMINIYKEEKQCTYRGENYLVRDNGAVLRLPKDNQRIRKLDNQWTFGKKDESNGYMFFTSKIRIHQIVATAFHGEPKRNDMVVDHIDTNRCNNRPDNLRWLSKLENVINNPITRRRIINICGSIEAFLNNPSIIRENDLEPNIKWMRTVSKEEAEYCKKNLERWSREDNNIYHGNGIGEWIFKEKKHYTSEENKSPQNHHLNNVQDDNKDDYVLSLTPSAIQYNWKTPTEFLLCPSSVNSEGLIPYFNKLQIGMLFSQNELYKSIIKDFAISEDKSKIWIALENNPKGWALVYITIHKDKYLHTTYSKFFTEEGMMKYFTENQGKEWTGGEVFDDYCL